MVGETTLHNAIRLERRSWCKVVGLKGILAVCLLVSIPALVSAAASATTCPDESEFKFTVNGNVYYIDQDHGPTVLGGQLGSSPGSVWQESNNVPGLQIGGIGLTGSYFPPGCDQDWTLSDLVNDHRLPGGTGPCLLIDEYPISDQCDGAGPDTYFI